MSRQKLRFGIIGPGSVAHIHSRAIKLAEDSELVAVYGRDEKKTKDFADQYSIKAYSDLETFLACDEIDAVTIATASGTHLDIGIQAASQGKHILCEKPLEITSQQAEKLIKACTTCNVQLGVFFQARFDKSTRLAKEAIRDGRLGKILLASCQMRWYRSQKYYDSAAWRGTWSLDGGGCLMNQGIHTIDLLLYLVGDPSIVSAFQGPLTHQRIEVEDNLCAAVRFKNGAVGTIEASTSCSPGFPRRIEISGENGSIGIEGNRIVRWEFNDRRPEDENAVTTGNTDIGGAADPAAIGITEHSLVIKDFVESIKENRQPFINGIEGKRAVDFVCAVYDSIRSEAAVTLK
jgi:predicted dehydrogenase